MNKIIILLVSLFALAVFALTACGDSTATSAESNAVETAQVAAAESAAKGVDKRVVKPNVGEMKKSAVSEPAANAPAAVTDKPVVSKTFSEGIHYAKISTRVKPAVAADKIAVQEMFWYGCPHCASLEPTTAKWKSTKPGDVEFEYIPAALNPTWSVHARAFYAAEQLGLTEATHENLFKAIHQQGRRINTEEALVRFFSAAGVNPDEFRAAMNNDETKKKVNLSASLAKRYGLTGVPSLIVDGQYRVLLYDGLRSYNELYEVVDYLIAKVRDERE